MFRNANSKVDFSKAAIGHDFSRAASYMDMSRAVRVPGKHGEPLVEAYAGVRVGYVGVQTFYVGVQKPKESPAKKEL